MAKKKDEEEVEEPESKDEPEDEEESKFGLGKIVKILIGIVLIVVGLGSYYYWWPELLVLVKGGLGAVVALIGLVVIMMGWSD